MKRQGWIVLSVGVTSAVIVASFVALLWAHNSVRTTPEEQEIVELANAFRLMHQIPKLKTDSELCTVARAMAKTLAKKGVAPPEKVEMDRALQAAGYKALHWGQTGIRREYLEPAVAFAEICKYSACREEIANTAYQDIGVGIVADPESQGYFYFQIYATRDRQ